MKISGLGDKVAVVIVALKCIQFHDHSTDKNVKPRKINGLILLCYFHILWSRKMIRRPRFIERDNRTYRRLEMNLAFPLIESTLTIITGGVSVDIPWNPQMGR